MDIIGSNNWNKEVKRYSITFTNTFIKLLLLRNIIICVFSLRIKKKFWIDRQIMNESAGNVQEN